MWLAAWPVHAATYYVATTGNDSNTGSAAAPFKNVQKAVGVVAPGDTVVIKPGAHRAFELRNINGAAGAPITFRGEPGAIIDRNLGGGNGYRNIEFYGGSYITIDSLELIDSDPMRGPIVDCSTTLTGSHSGRNAIKLNRTAGSGTPYPRHLIFSNLHVHDVGGSAILGSAEESQLINSHIHDLGDMATNQLAYGTYIKGRRWIIRGNRIHNNNGNGMRTGNDPSTSTTELLVDAIIENNLIYNNGGRGAHPSGPTGCRIITGGDGIVVWHGSGNIIRNNVLNNNLSYGIRVNEDFTLNNKPNLVYNNTVYKSGFQGLYCYDGESTIVKNNISYLSGRENIFSGCVNQLSNNLITDPRFVNPAAGDFHLLSGSPAINAGANLFSVGVTKDFAGGARPQTGPFEIGAYEYGGSTPPPPAFDFSLSNGGNKTVTRGASVTNSLTASLVSGTAQSVSFSISGLPSGVTGGFSPASCTPNCSSTLTLSASAATALGTAGLTVTAAGGGVTKTSAFTLTVNAPQTSTHSVTLSSTQAAPGAAFTATVKGGSGSVTQWVAVYLATAPDSASSYKSNWKYLNGTKTAPAAAVATPVQLTFAAPPDAGVYNLRFFANTGTGTRLALSSNLTVSSATDLNGDGITNVADVQIAVNQAVGAAACGSGDVNKDGACNVSDVQLVINKALGL